MTPLSFYDWHRQEYSDTLPFREGHMVHALFMVGEYSDEGGAGEGGEFVIHLVLLAGELVPHVLFYGDGGGSLRRAIDAGLLDQLEHIEHKPAPWGDDIRLARDAFSRRLLGIGLLDRSDRGMETKR